MYSCGTHTLSSETKIWPTDVYVSKTLLLDDLKRFAITSGRDMEFTASRTLVIPASASRGDMSADDSEGTYTPRKKLDHTRK